MEPPVSPSEASATRPPPDVGATVRFVVSDAGDGSPHVEGTVESSTTIRAFAGWMELLGLLEQLAAEQLSESTEA